NENPISTISPIGPILRATPTDKLDRLLVFRGIHPLYGAFLVEQLGTASPEERLQAFESVLEMPRPLLKLVRVPYDLPPGPCTTAKLDPELVNRGLIVAKPPKSPDDEEEEQDEWEERPPSFPENLFMYFESL